MDLPLTRKRTTTTSRHRLLLVLAAGLTSGCATSIRITSPEGVVEVVPPPELAKSARCSLRLCVLDTPLKPHFFDGNEATTQQAVLAGLRPSFTFVTMIPEFDAGRSCDVGLRYTNLGWASADLLSAYTNEPLARLDADFTQMGSLVCRLFALGGEPRRKLDAEIAAARAAKPGAPAQAAAPASSLIPSDVERPSYRLPEAANRFAVVVGIEKYSDLPDAQFAERDATAVKRHLLALGYPERNVVHLSGPKAGRASLEKYVEQWLPKLVGEDGEVFFYFSGHGAPDVKTGTAYLVPWDGDPNFLETTAYPVKRLYEKLGKLKARRILVAMDACFSGAGGRSVLAAGARPLVSKVDVAGPVGRIVALTASGANEVSGTEAGQGHGAFTYHLLKGLNGGAQDAAGHVSVQGLHKYLTPKVQDAARRLNRDQTPQLMPADAAEIRLR